MLTFPNIATKKIEWFNSIICGLLLLMNAHEPAWKKEETNLHHTHWHEDLSRVSYCYKITLSNVFMFIELVTNNQEHYFFFPGITMSYNWGFRPSIFFLGSGGEEGRRREQNPCGPIAFTCVLSLGGSLRKQFPRGPLDPLSSLLV